MKKTFLKLLKPLTLVLLFLIISCKTKNLNKIENTETVITISTLLDEMVNRETIAKYPTSNFRLKQESSYNRASKTPEDEKGWFNNKDFNSNKKDHNFIRIEENNGKKEWVLMDHKGAGAIVRTWMPFKNAKKPNTDIQIKIYLDGAKEPVLQGNMLGLLNGTGLIPYPFAHKSLRSAVSFFPIPYAKSCKITVTNRPFFYQFTYREYDKDTPIKTFTMADFKASKTQIEKVGNTLLSSENRIVGEKISVSAKLNPNEEKAIDLPEGTASVRELALKLNSYQDSTITRNVIVKMQFDGKQTVWCPISEFFGTGVGLNPFKGWYRTVAEDGTLSTRWVMPYKKSGLISILNKSDQSINIELSAKTGDWKWDKNSMYFHAGYRQQYPVATRPFSDWNYIEIKGKGVYVGDALTIMNPVEKWWGEGDEKIWVDGEDFPSIFGTGTEDYYGYSWGGISTDFYEHPFHAQPRSNVYNKLNRKTTNEKNTKGFSTETRTRALDGMPFETSLKLDMEVWHWKECDMEFAVGAYWYGMPEATSNRDNTLDK